MRRLTKNGVAVALSAALLVTLGPTGELVKTQAAGEYTYLYAGLTWEQYWDAENIYLQDGKKMSDSNEELDARGEADKGAFDAVSRATTNHGLHRGSYQCDTVIYAEDGSTYEVSHWSKDGATLYLTDGTSVAYSKGTITKADGSSTTLKEYKVYGLKYVPVAVKTDELADFKKAYKVVENDGTLVGGYGEQSLSAYELTAEVTANTNGLKTATENKDGSFRFSARKTGSDSGIKGADLATAEKIEATVKEASGSYGEFLRVDINNADGADAAKGEGYGALGAKMQAVRWNYYGNDETRKTPLATFGTKFAADNWMHKSMGIQLGLTDSYRAQLPGGTDGTGYWSLTIYALGLKDTTIDFKVGAENLVDDVTINKAADTTKLEALVKEAEALKEADYTAASWKDFAGELAEAQEELAKTAHYQAVVDEAYTHLSAAMKSLVAVAKPAQSTVKVPAGVTVKAKKKQLTVLWKKVSGVKGYQVQYSTAKNFKKAVAKTTAKNSLNIKKLKTGKKYYVRVRAYAVVNGKNVYSKWSSAKNVKVK